MRCWDCFARTPSEYLQHSVFPQKNRLMTNTMQRFAVGPKIYATSPPSPRPIASSLRQSEELQNRLQVFHSSSLVLSATWYRRCRSKPHGSGDHGYSTFMVLEQPEGLMTRVCACVPYPNTSVFADWWLLLQAFAFVVPICDHNSLSRFQVLH